MQLGGSRHGHNVMILLTLTVTVTLMLPAHGDTRCASDQHSRARPGTLAVWNVVCSSTYVSIRHQPTHSQVTNETTSLSRSLLHGYAALPSTPKPILARFNCQHYIADVVDHFDSLCRHPGSH